MQKSGKKVYLITNGCPENNLDLARLQELLQANGWLLTATVEDADLIFFNACGLTQYNEKVSLKIVQQLQARKQPSAELIVYGCLPKINPTCVQAVYQGPTFGSDELERVADLIDIQTDPAETYANYLLPSTEDVEGSRHVWDHFKKLGSLMAIKERLVMGHVHELWHAINVVYPYSFCIKISTGCLCACAFCAVKLSRGNVRSKTIPDVMQEFDAGLAQGYHSFGLIGTDLGSYGRDQGITLVNLLKELLQRDGEYEIRVRNIQPRFLIEMMPELYPLFQTGKIAYISSAAESGSNRILKLMNRGYQIEAYKTVIQTLNRDFPQMQISTQLIAGFPSETDAEFQESVRLLDELCFDLVEVYQFEARPGTKAATLPDPVPAPIARRRYHHLFMKAAFNQRERKKTALKTYKAAMTNWQKYGHALRQG